MQLFEKFVFSKNTINNLDDGIKTMKIALTIKESGKKKKNIVMQ